MSAIEQRVAETLDWHGIRSTRIVVAVSGGADSLALLHALVALRHARGLDVHAAHLNHSLRGADADADAEWVAAQCAALGVPCTTERCDVPSASQAAGTGLEETARNLRYDFLIHTARATATPWVALAHNADDQVETVLHRILRGTGLSGLAGMPVTRPLAEGITLIRPLLDVSRAETEAALLQHGVSWREDASNASLEFTRNRIRHQLLPLLRTEFNPQADAAILRLARQAREADSVVQAAAADMLRHVLLEADRHAARLDCAALADVPRHQVRLLLHRLWRQQDWPAGGMTFAHWDALAELLLAGGTALSLPGGIAATRRGPLLHLQRPESA